MGALQDSIRKGPQLALRVGAEMGKWEAVTGAEPWGFGLATVISQHSVVLGERSGRKRMGLEAVSDGLASHILFTPPVLQFRH